MRIKTTRVRYLLNYAIPPILFLMLILVWNRFGEEWRAYLALSVVAVFSLILLLEPEFKRIYRYYLLDKDGVYLVKGIITRRRTLIPYKSITELTVTETLIGKLLRFGDVRVKGIETEIEIKGVRNPKKIYRFIRKRMKKGKKK